MKYHHLARRLGLIPLAAATLALLATAACTVSSEPGDPQTTTAGGAGMSTSAGGSAAGSTGTAGTPSGGTGTAGMAGATAGSGGTAGTNAGAGGTAGTAGGGGAGGSGGTGGATVVDHNAAGAIVILGSSTSAGTGPKDPANAWVERYRAYLKTNYPNFKLTNLAVGGYTTYQIQPSDYAPTGGRPGPDKSHNITFALTLKPNAIIINMPTNDTNANYPATDQMANFDRVTKLAEQNGVMSWVTTTQARNFGGDSAAVQMTKHALLITVRDQIKAKYTDHTLDFWTGFAEDNGNIKAMWDSGDGTHMNDAAHALLVQQAIDAKIAEAVAAKK